MKSYQVKRRRREWVNWFLVLILLLLGWFLLKSVWGLAAKERLTREERRVVERERDRLSKQEADLSIKVEALGTRAGVEAALREKFPVALPDERVVNIVDDNSLEIIKPLPLATWWQVVWREVQFWK